MITFDNVFPTKVKYISTMLLFIMILFSQIAVSQDNGYWDKDRITSKTVVVSAGKRIAIQSEDFPIGTTEILFRITLLNENQELSSNLVSLLKSIPDPTGISQGSAGAVFLLSKISGNDKCTYAIFTNEKNAINYRESGNTFKACFSKAEKISKDAKLLSINKTLCLKEQTQNVWFGFESKNWLMNQKIILEIVPWINNKKARGWNEITKKTTIQTIKNSDFDFKMLRAQVFNLAVLDKIEKNYTFAEFKELQSVEQLKIITDFGNQVFKETNINNTLFTQIRLDAVQHFKAQKFDLAIDLIEKTIMNYNVPTAKDYNLLAYCYLFSNQNPKALQNLQKAEQLDNANLAIQLNLAHVYLLSNQYSKAKAIYKKYKKQNIDAKTTFKSKAIQDFQDLEKAGIFSEDYKNIIDKLNEN